MKAEKYLQQLELLDIKINQDIHRLEEMRVAAGGVGAISYDKDSVQTSPTGDRLCLDVARIVELERQITEDINGFVAGKNQIISEIQGLDDPLQVQVLYKRYVEYKTFFRIADEIGRKDRAIRYIHKHALAEFEQRYHLDQLF